MVWPMQVRDTIRGYYKRLEPPDAVVLVKVLHQPEVSLRGYIMSKGLTAWSHSSLRPNASKVHHSVRL